MKRICQFLSFFIFLFRLIFLQFVQCLSGQRIQKNNIKDRHQPNSHISQIPHKSICSDPTAKQHDQCQDLISSLPAPFLRTDTPRYFWHKTEAPDRCLPAEEYGSYLPIKRIDFLNYCHNHYKNYPRLSPTAHFLS